MQTNYVQFWEMMKAAIFKDATPYNLVHGSRREFAVGVRTARCAEVARRKGRSHEGPSVEQGRRKNSTRNPKPRRQGAAAFWKQRTTRGIYRSPLDWKSQSELPDMLLGYTESKTGPCGEVDPLQNEKRIRNCTESRSR
jgi:hypothetical protein